MPGEQCDCTGLRPHGYCAFQVLDCRAYGDPMSCLSDPKCAWSGGDELPAPCYCNPEDSTCLCYPGEPGYCFDRGSEPDCFGYFDELSCGTDSSCEWVVPGMDPAPCFCDPNAPDCHCDNLMPRGYCQPAATTSCWDLNQELCVTDAGCEWFDGMSPMPPPMPVECPVDVKLDEQGNCFAADGQIVDSSCCWTDSFGYCAPATVIEPCFGLREGECLADLACSWNTNHGAPPLPECEGAAYGEDGLCYVNGMQVEVFCCESGNGYGYCEPFAQTCEARTDAQSCLAQGGCEWASLNCEPCPDGEQCNCGPDSGICSELPRP